MKIITVIPARGGSKSLPNKNILPLKGKPLLCYSVEYSLRSQLITSTVVSTDAERIAQIARRSGASVPFIRPKEYATDSARDYPVIRHALDFFEGKGEIFDLYVLLRPTSPLRPVGLIERAIEIFEKNSDATSVRSMARVKEHPYRVWKYVDNSSVSGIIDYCEEPYNIPRQELPELYFQTGDIEVIRRETIINGSVSGNRVYPLIIAHDEMIDIDSQSDLDRAENSDGAR